MVRLHARVMLRKVPPRRSYRPGPGQLGGLPKWGLVPIDADEARGTAQDFLSAILANGPARQTLIVERGAERGFSDDQLRRAKRALGIRAFKQRGQPQSPWFWALPAGCTGGRGRTGMRAGENRSRSRSRSRKQKTATLENF